MARKLNHPHGHLPLDPHLGTPDEPGPTAESMLPTKGEPVSVLGPGTQWYAWVAKADVVEAIIRAALDPTTPHGDLRAGRPGGCHRRRVRPARGRRGGPHPAHPTVGGAAPGPPAPLAPVAAGGRDARRLSSQERPSPDSEALRFHPPPAVRGLAAVTGKDDLRPRPPSWRGERVGLTILSPLRRPPPPWPASWTSTRSWRQSGDRQDDRSLPHRHRAARPARAAVSPSADRRRPAAARGAARRRDRPTRAAPAVLTGLRIQLCGPVGRRRRASRHAPARSARRPPGRSQTAPSSPAPGYARPERKTPRHPRACWR